MVHNASQATMQLQGKLTNRRTADEAVSPAGRAQPDYSSTSFSPYKVCPLPLNMLDNIYNLQTMRLTQTATTTR